MLNKLILPVLLSATSAYSAQKIECGSFNEDFQAFDTFTVEVEGSERSSAVSLAGMEEPVSVSSSGFLLSSTFYDDTQSEVVGGSIHYKAELANTSLQSAFISWSFGEFVSLSQELPDYAPANVVIISKDGTSVVRKGYCEFSN